MSTALTSSLKEAAARTFEELAFLLLMDEPAPPRDGHGGTGMRVTFSGAVAGRLELEISPALLPVIAMNMLGAGEPPPIAQQLDAIGEVANVIAGNLVPSLAGARGVVRLGAPEPATGAPPSSSEPATAARLVFDDGDADVRLFLDAP